MISAIRWHHVLGASGLLLVLAAATKISDVDLWGEPHTAKDDLMSNRVECPRRWGVVPLFEDREHQERIRAVDPKDSSLAPSYFIRTGGGWEWHSKAAKIGSAGDITNIPEFHDCQRFVSDDGRKFDSLFAIFA